MGKTLYVVLDSSRVEKDSYRIFDNGSYIRYARFDKNEVIIYRLFF